jgi:hypothetical protein
MSTSKHPGPGQARPPRDDLETDPGIGASRGTTMAGEDPHILREDGENTEEGDVGNDTDATGAVVPNARHRTNP